MSNFGFNFHPSNLFFDRGIEKSHNLMKRSWRLLFILVDYPVNDYKAQCKLQ